MAQKEIVKEIPWSLASAWNIAAKKDNRPLVPRNYLYASELGSPMIDVWLKMKAVPFTNPPNDRSLRKFLMGGIVEHVVTIILAATGVYKASEIKVDSQIKGMLSVHGRLDFIAGGHVDKDKAMQVLQTLLLPDFLITVAERIINELAGKTMKETILELKSCSSYAFEVVEKRKRPMPNHALQGFHYQFNKGIPADIAYISKDSCLMAQFHINEEETKPLYLDYIKQMTNFVKKNVQPPLEPLAKFDETTGNFTKNFGVEYSPYLTLLYGFGSPEDYRDAVGFIIRWNRAVGRFAQVVLGHLTPTGKVMAITPKNLEVKNEIIKAGFNFDHILQCKIIAGIGENSEEE